MRADRAGIPEPAGVRSTCGRRPRLHLRVVLAWLLLVHALMRNPTTPFRDPYSPAGATCALPTIVALCSCLGCFVEIADDDVHTPVASRNPPSWDTSSQGDSAFGNEERGSYSEPADDGPAPNPPEAIDTDPLDGRYRSLLVVDPTVLEAGSDDLDPDAPYSFRNLMAWLGQTENPDRFVYDWLRHWRDGGSVAGLQAPGQSAVHARLMQGWIDAPLVDPVLDEEPASEWGDAGTPDSAQHDNDDLGEASYDAEPTLHWGDAPFRLIAIVPRVDLAGEACSGSAGELRFVFAGSDWRYDTELELTVILELELPQSTAPAAWAQRFLRLEALSAPDYAAELAVLTHEISATAEPLAARLRTNEAALSDPSELGWRLREFRPRIVEGALQLLSAPLSSTPSQEADPNRVATHLLDNSQRVRQGPVALPADLQAVVAHLPAQDFRWVIPGLSDALSQAFSLNTCNGCHGGDTQALPFQHLAPGASPRHPARISSFLYDPNAESDELSRRQAKLLALSEIICPQPTAPSRYPGSDGN